MGLKGALVLMPTVVVGGGSAAHDAMHGVLSEQRSRGTASGLVQYAHCPF
jgi:hypothetical protein